MIKKTFYFGHDYNARNDEKIIKLISKEGWEGYGIYWAIIEKLYEAGGYLDEDYECIAFDLRTEYDRITTVIENYNLFEVVNKKISSKSVLVRLRHTFGISEKNRQNIKKRWDKQRKGHTTVLRPYPSGNTIKEIKRKEIKENNILPPVGGNAKKSYDGLYSLLEKPSIEKPSDNIPPKNISEIIDIFRKTNKSIKFENKTERKAAEDIIKDIGFLEAVKWAEFAVHVQGVEFAPQITTPFFLWKKLTQLKSHYKTNEKKYEKSKSKKSCKYAKFSKKSVR